MTKSGQTVVTIERQMSTKNINKSKALSEQLLAVVMTTTVDLMNLLQFIIY